MTLTIDLAPELEHRLREAAERRGQEVGEFVTDLIEQSLPAIPPAGQSLWHSLTPEEWARAFDEWAHSNPSNAPPLSDEAISRESIYEGNPRWPN
jgi:hypothetical protein